MAKTVSGLLINDYKPIGRGNYGIRVARKGFDAMNSADSNLLFNSNWPIIQIVKVVSTKEPKMYIDESEDIPDTYIHLYDTEDNTIYIDEQYVYPKKIVKLYINPQDYTQHRYYQRYRVYHGLGYIPMFFYSDEISNLADYLVLTNIDIRKDVDYPYTDKPSYYNGMTADYGIKSKSRTRDKLPSHGVRGCGINTNIQSKLIMAVKTEKTKVEDEGGQQARPVAWGLPKDNNTQDTTSLYDFEGYVFYANDDTEGKFTRYPVARIYPENDEKGGRWEPGGTSPLNPTGLKTALVIVRSPMVAPDYEEIEV